jgi:hypothetical protein
MRRRLPLEEVPLREAVQLLLQEHLAAEQPRPHLKEQTRRQQRNEAEREDAVVVAAVCN